MRLILHLRLSRILTLAPLPFCFVQLPFCFVRRLHYALRNLLCSRLRLSRIISLAPLPFCILQFSLLCEQRRLPSIEA
jgi:hypothetical protein